MKQIEKSSLKLVLLTLTFTWIPWLYLAFGVQENQTSNPLYIIGGLGPIFGFLVATLHDRITKKIWINPFTKVKSVKLLILLLPLVSALPVLISGVIGKVFFDVQFDTAGWNDSVAQYGGLIFFIAIIFIGGPFTEEWSWHGYLWPRVRSMNSMLKAAMIVGFIWALWHLPLFLIDETSQSNGLSKNGYLFFFIFSCLMQMYLWGQYYELTGYGVFSGILAHFTLNLSSFIINYDYRVRTVEMFVNVLVIAFLHRISINRKLHVKQ